MGRVGDGICPGQSRCHEQQYDHHPHCRTKSDYMARHTGPKIRKAFVHSV